MPKAPVPAETVLVVLIDRIKKVPVEETRKKLGYRDKGAITRIVNQFGLAELEAEIRGVCYSSSNQSDLSPEALALNRDYDAKLKEASDKIHALLDRIDNPDAKTPAVNSVDFENQPV